MEQPSKRHQRTVGQFRWIEDAAEGIILFGNQKRSVIVAFQNTVDDLLCLIENIRFSLLSQQVWFHPQYSSIIDFIPNSTAKTKDVGFVQSIGDAVPFAQRCYMNERWRSSRRQCPVRVGWYKPDFNFQVSNQNLQWGLDAGVDPINDLTWVRHEYRTFLRTDANSIDRWWNSEWVSTKGSIAIDWKLMNDPLPSSTDLLIR